MCDSEGDLGDPDPKQRTKAIENHYKWVDAAKFLGCHSIRVNARSSGSYDEQIKLATDGLRRLTEFAKDKRAKDGLQTQCRACYANYHIDNKKQILKRKKAYRAKPENKRRRLETCAKYESEHRDEINQNKKDRLNENPLLRKQMNLRIRLSNALKREVELQKREVSGSWKRNKVGGQHLKDKLELERILGCTIAEYKEYIESTWTKGMSWDNYGCGKGKWSIDHIIPVDANWTLNDYQICFWYKNTEATWYNREKGNKYDEKKKQKLIDDYFRAFFDESLLANLI